MIKIFLFQTLVQSKNRSWINFFPLLLNCITSVKFKIESILLTLNNTKVPWSQTLREIAQNALNYNHELVQILRETIENEPVFEVMQKPLYQLSNFTIDNRVDVSQLRK